MDLSLDEPPPPVGSLIFLHRYAPVWDSRTGNASERDPGPIILTCNESVWGVGGNHEWEEEMRDDDSLGLLRGFSANMGCFVDFLQVDIVEKVEPDRVE